MAATVNEVRRLAMAMPGVIEGVCFGTPTFYLGKKLMLRLWEDLETLVVKLPIDQRDALIDDEPHLFSITDHYKNYPAILVSLPNVSLPRLKQLIDGAWRTVASPKQIAALDSGGVQPQPKTPKRLHPQRTRSTRNKAKSPDRSGRAKL